MLTTCVGGCAPAGRGSGIAAGLGAGMQQRKTARCAVHSHCAEQLQPVLLQNVLVASPDGLASNSRRRTLPLPPPLLARGCHAAAHLPRV